MPNDSRVFVASCMVSRSLSLPIATQALRGEAEDLSPDFCATRFLLSGGGDSSPDLSPVFGERRAAGMNQAGRVVRRGGWRRAAAGGLRTRSARACDCRR